MEHFDNAAEHKLNPPSRRTRAEWRAIHDSELVSVNTRLPRALRDELKKQSVKEKRKIQDIYADALRAYLERKKD